MPEAFQPTDFREALEFARARGILPTQLSSQDLRELSAEMRRRSLFSARVTNAQFLQELADQIEELQQGRTNLATAMMEMREVLTELDYTPELGFPGDAARGIPPAEKYDLRDISSHKRLSLMLETNQAQAYGEGRRQQGNTREAVAQFPAWELIRISPRRVPRGFQSTKTGLMPVPGDSWQERFVRAGGTLVGDGRMIARKDDSVWERLGDSNEFPDGLDQPFPPFAFNSGMDWRAVPRREAIELGIIDPGEDAIPEDGVRFTGAFEITEENFDPAIFGELKREIDTLLANRAALTQFDDLLNRLEAALLHPLPAGEGRGEGEPRALLNTFDPDQPRAADGKWTGSAGSGNHTTDSPEFKEWFGKSKVIDEDGKPLVVLHGGAGAKSDFSAGSGRGVGLAYFTDSPEVASKYAIGGGIKEGETVEDYAARLADAQSRGQLVDRDPSVTPVFLAIENPITERTDGMDLFEGDRAKAEKLLFQWSPSFSEKTEFEEGLEGRLSDEQWWRTVDELLREPDAGVGEDFEALPPNMRGIASVKSMFPESFPKFDGLIYEDREAGGTTYVVFHPTQIKSATGNSGKFSRTDPRIANTASELLPFSFSLLPSSA